MQKYMSLKYEPASEPLHISDDDISDDTLAVPLRPA